MSKKKDQLKDKIKLISLKLLTMIRPWRVLRLSNKMNLKQIYDW